MGSRRSLQEQRAAVCAGMVVRQNTQGLGLDWMSKVTNSFPTWVTGKGGTTEKKQKEMKKELVWGGWLIISVLVS